jgi:hypothetical protein
MTATSQNLHTTININGRAYTARRLRPSQAIPLATRLAKIIGPGLGKALPSEADIKAGKKINVGALFEGLAPSLDEAKVDSFIKDMMGPVAYENTFLTGNAYEDHFTNYLEDLFPLIGELVQFQFGNFFKGLLTAKGSPADSGQA